MFSTRRLVLVFAVVAALLLVALPALADNEDLLASACEGITHQVRFFDYNDIPLFTSSADAENADAVYQGGEGTVSPYITVPGGERQKYLLCNRSYDSSARFVEVVFVGDGEISTFFAPTALVESIVERYKRDGQY